MWTCIYLSCLWALVNCSHSQEEDPGRNIDLSTSRDYYCPGCIIDTLDTNVIHEALSQILNDVSWLWDRRACAMAISNHGTYTYTNLQYWLDSGSVEGFLPPQIAPGQTGLLLFTSNFVSVSGTSGVLSLDIDTNPSFLVSVMWSITTSVLFYDDWHNFKVYPHSQIKSPDKEMFEQLYYYAGPFPTNGWHERNEFGVNMYGTLSEQNHARHIVQLDNKNFSPIAGPSYHVECKYRSLVSGSRCRRECSPFGRCWTNAECGNDRDCSPDMSCGSACD